MAKFKLEFEMDNEAFDDNQQYEIARILDEIKRDVLRLSTGRKIRDINGNTVGKWDIWE
jgi:hypothetical protein